MKIESFPSGEQIRSHERIGVLDRFETENSDLVGEFNSTRVVMNENDFANMYRNFKRDEGEAQKLDSYYKSQRENSDVFGDITEVLAYGSITKRNSLGKDIKSRKLSLHDDFINGEDLGIYAIGSANPIVSGIDVTSNQDLEGRNKHDGLHKKMERAKSHIDLLSSLEPDMVNDFKIWFNSGGAAKSTGIDGKKQAEFEKLLEKVVVLKYYKTASDEETPNTPMAVFAAPQMVLAYDKDIVNAIAFGGERDKRTMPEYFDNITVLETRMYMKKLSEYIRSQGNRNNYLFESYQIAVDTWLARFSTPEFVELYNKARQNINSGDAPDIVKKQIRYFGETLEEVFRIVPKKVVTKIESEESPDLPSIPKDIIKRDRPILGIKK